MNKSKVRITNFDVDWIELKGFDCFYEINEFGQIRNKDGKILKTCINSGGYEVITLRKNKKKKQLYIHRLVAEYFIPNPNNHREINHKNEDKLDNHKNNLEWCNRRYNSIYGTKLERQRQSNPLKKKIVQYSLTNDFIKTWDSITLASRELNISRANIVQCLRINKRKTAGGYVWKEI